jgi:Ca2+-binding EF-hand superfamily protein
MKRMHTSLLLLLLLPATAGVAFAQAPQTMSTNPPASTAQHGQMDHGAMGHGQMDRSSKKPADHAKMAANEFASLDKNKDGKLSAAEVPAKSALKPHFSMLDANKDGALSKAEHAKHHGK